MNRLAVSTFAITAACLGAYFAIRSLPVEPCEFLHYGEYVNAEGVIEGCGFDDVDFFDLNELKYPILVELRPLSVLEAQAPADILLKLETSSGNRINWDAIAVSHTERIHAMVIGPELEDYHHVHPVPAGPPGEFLLSFTPRSSGQYRIFLDFIPLASGRRTLLAGDLSVAPSPGHQPLQRKPKALQADTHGFAFHLQPRSEQISAGEEVEYVLNVSRQDGSAPVLEPVMDSYAHLVVFDLPRSGFAHMHPLDYLEAKEPMLNPDLRFRMRAASAGLYRVWAQVRLEGQDIFVPFDLEVL